MKPLLKEDSLIQVKDILKAHQNVKDVVIHTPLQRNDRLSERYGRNIYLKREDLQVVRSFKLRGAYNKMRRLSKSRLKTELYAQVRETMRRGLRFHANTSAFTARFLCRQPHRDRKYPKWNCSEKNLLKSY